MDIFTNTFDEREYSPNNQTYIDSLKKIDPDFTVGNKVADINANATYVYRCEFPYNHYVSFYLATIIQYLPRTLHEYYDRSKPLRLAFDIEQTYTKEMIENAYNRYKEQGGAPIRLRDYLERYFTELTSVYVANIDKIIRPKFLGKFMPALNGGKKKKVQELDLLPTILESFRYVPDNYLFAVKQPGYCELEPRFSCHIIYKDVWLIDSHEAEAICMEVHKEISKTSAALAARIDTSIYQHVNFRAYGCSKKNEPNRVLRLLGEIDMPQPRDEYNLQRGHKPTHVMPHKKRAQPKEEEVKEVQDDEFAELTAHNTELLVNFRLERQSRDTIRLRADGAAYCPICERCHRSGAQNFIKRTKIGYIFRCGHPDSKGKRGIIMRLPMHVNEYHNNIPAIMNAMDIYEGKQYEQTITINKKYIEDDLAVEYARGTNMIFVSSPMGTGKTYALRKFLEVVGQQSICMLSFRKAFTAEKAKDLGLISYLDIEDKIDEEKTPHIIIQVEALGRLSSTFAPNVLIIDEMESILEQINKVEGNMRAAAMDTLKRVIVKARAIVIMDANLTTASIKYFTRIRQDLTYRIILNTYKHTDITAKIYGNNTASVTNAFINFVVHRGPAVMCSDSKMILDATRERLILAGIQPDQIFVASSETAEERKRLVDECGNMTIVVSKYRAFLYNTTLLAGVSIEDPTKRNLFAVFDSKYITPSAACQLIGRVRHVETLHIGAHNINKAPRKKATHIGILMRTICDNLFANAKELPAQVPPLLRLYAKNKAAREFGQASLLECIIILLARHGYAIEFMPIVGGKKLFAAIAKAREAELDRIIATPETEFAKAKYERVMYDGHVPLYLHQYLNKDDLRAALRPDVGLMLGNLRYIETANAREEKPGVMAIGVKYDIMEGMGRETNNIDSALEACTGESNEALITGLAVSFLRGLRCDMSGIMPRCDGILRAVWQEYLEKFAQDNGIIGQNNEQRMRKMNRILMAALGVKFVGSKQRESTPTGRQPVNYIMKINDDIEQYDGRWQLKCVRRAQIEHEKRLADEARAKQAAE